jgi:hypothetical protein
MKYEPIKWMESIRKSGKARTRVFVGKTPCEV